MIDVALIIERIETWRGGAETSTVQFAGHLARNGCKVHVITTSNVPSTPELHVIPIRAKKIFQGSRTWLFARRAARYVRKHRFDIVHSITPCLAADVYQPRGGTVPEMLARNVALRPAAGQRGLKRLAQRLNMKYRVLGRLERKLLTRKPPPTVIAISQYVSDQLARHYGFDSSLVRPIFNGIDLDDTSPEQQRADRTEVRRQYGLADDDLVVLAVAHNFKLKGINKLIEAVARLKHEHAYAVVVGRDNPGPYAKLADRLGVANRVIFAGPTQRIQAFFHAADMLAHPTFYDPCSRVVLEAMSSGLPVITTRFNGAAELITDGEQGYVIDSPDDVDALADRIARLADADHRISCANNASQSVEQVTMQRHAENVLALYREIIDRNEGQPLQYR